MSEDSQTVLTEIRAELRGMRADQRQDDGRYCALKSRRCEPRLRGEIAELRGAGP